MICIATAPIHGSCSVTQIFRYARREHLSFLSLTDHDSMAGFEEAKAASEKTGVGFIPGIECTAKDPVTLRPIHILCYGMKKVSALQVLTEETSRRRKAAKLKMAELVSAKYPLVSVEDVEYLARNSSSIFESHIMLALANAGITNAPYGELMSSLIGKQGSCHVPIDYPLAEEVIRIMHDSGGLVIIAHPGEFDSMDFTEKAAKNGEIDGIECFHYANTPEVTAHCLDIAKLNGLIITGGSDFHGMNSVHPHPIGFCRTDETNLKRIIEHSIR